MADQSLDGILAIARRVVAGSAGATEIATIEERARRPLRVAIAGRTKAGKSTLLNALVGERLAATDATECTRIVTWYRFDLGYSVTARLRSGETRSLDVDRADGPLNIRLGGLDVSEIERLEVGWPSSRLTDLTLIDTPGLDSSSERTSQRTVEALVGEDERPGDADAVIYLMRHLHRRDATFLEAFEQRIGSASPVTAIGLLSRSDEIGAGRMDAMDSVARIAQRYAADARVGRLALTVLPFAGLLAETGASLRESEHNAVRLLSALEPEDRATILLSADRFRGRSENPLPREMREQLLARFGLYGLRQATKLVAGDPGSSSADLARLLVNLSGIRDVEGLIRRQFADRAEALKMRSALMALRAIGVAAMAGGRSGGDELVAAVERAEASSPQLATLRALHLTHAGATSLDGDERVEIDRILGSGSVASRLTTSETTPVGELRSIALAAVDRWRSRAADPLLERSGVEVAETVARAYEAAYQELTAAT
jgi:hypothetical protein